MARIRTFIAIDPDLVVQKKAESIIRKLSETTRSVRWVEATNLHLTLKFLGEVEESEIYQVCRRVKSAARQHAPFRVNCRGLGAFPSLERPRTVWFGIDEPQGEVSQLQATVDAELEALRFPREIRRFRPHVTLGRLQQRGRQTESLTAALFESEDLEVGTFRVHECLVYASQLTPHGPRYTVLGRAPLGD